MRPAMVARKAVRQDGQVYPPGNGFCRPMLRTDLRDVREIECMAYDFPWSKGVFADCLRAGYHCIVVQTAIGLGGYAIGSSVVGETHILNLCVRPDWQRRGFATLLLQRLFVLAQAENVKTIFLEVRPSNTAAIKLYERLGFREFGIRPNYYPAQDGREDALLMAREL